MMDMGIKIVIYVKDQVCGSDFDNICGCECACDKGTLVYLQLRTKQLTSLINSRQAIQVFKSQHLDHHSPQE